MLAELAPRTSAKGGPTWGGPALGPQTSSDRMAIATIKELK